MGAESSQQGIEDDGSDTLAESLGPDHSEVDALVAAFAAGRFVAAEVLAQAMVVNFPRGWLGWKALGTVLQQMGRSADALVCLQKTLILSPCEIETQNALGNTLKDLTRLPEAERWYRRALWTKPDFAEAHSNLGLMLKVLGRLKEAESSHRRALAAKPNFAEAHNNLGLIYKAAGRLDVAETHCRLALTLRPYFAEAYSNIGNLLSDTERLDEAVVCYRTALAIRPGYAEGLNNLGASLNDLNQLVEAERCCMRALKINPIYPEAHGNLGIILMGQRRMNEAEASYRAALKIRADDADAHSNLGIILKFLGRLGEAEKHYLRAMEIDPDHPMAHWNNSLCRLLAGDFARGWPEHEWRFRNKELGIKERRLSQPLWLGGEPLAGRTILLHSEQGLGDTIQFCRYATQVAQLGARVILEVQPPLTTLLRNLAGVAAVVSSGEDLPDFDCHCPLPSLPLALKVDLDNISNLPYLSSDAQKVAAWREKLTPGNRKRIGLAWSGSKEHSNDLNRSIALSQFMVLLDPRADYYCLQKELRPDDQAVLQQSASVRFFGNELADFSDTAALVDLMDLVITVDTSLAHLAGALGKRVWILLPYAPDWRWLLGRSDSPWYRSARLFRQPAVADWVSVLDAVRAEQMTNG